MRFRCLVLAATIFAGTNAAHAIDMPDVPDALAVPGGKVVASMIGSGAQVYECARTPKGELAWSFREPSAALFQDGKTVGRHFGGPTWEFPDGTHVTGRVVSKEPAKDPQNIPWLKLELTERARKGPAADAKFVLRIATQGGSVSGACTAASTFRAEPYQATYVFVK